MTTRPGMPALPNIWSRFLDDFLGIFQELRLSYLPPLMVYLAAGVSSFTGIIESFFIKDGLGLSAEFLAGLAFWAGLPWALKMPLGHLVDLFCRRKSFFVYLGAGIMAFSLLIMVGLTGYIDHMAGLLKPETCYIISVLLSPIGFVMQDVVADAMTVEAVPDVSVDGSQIPEDQVQRMHVTVQTLGRVAIIGGSAMVAGLFGWLAKALSYVAMYKMSLVIPLISVLGVVIAAIIKGQRKPPGRALGVPGPGVQLKMDASVKKMQPDWSIIGGSCLFVVIALIFGVSDLALKKNLFFSDHWASSSI